MGSIRPADLRDPVRGLVCPFLPGVSQAPRNQLPQQWRGQPARQSPRCTCRGTEAEGRLQPEVGQETGSIS